MKFVFHILGNNPLVLSDGDDCLELVVAKQQKRSYESVSLPEGNFLFLLQILLLLRMVKFSTLKETINNHLRHSLIYRIYHLLAWRSTLSNQFDFNFPKQLYEHL